MLRKGYFSLQHLKHEQWIRRERISPSTANCLYPLAGVLTWSEGNTLIPVPSIWFHQLLSLYQQPTIFRSSWLKPYQACKSKSAFLKANAKRLFHKRLTLEIALIFCQRIFWADIYFNLLRYVFKSPVSMKASSSVLPTVGAQWVECLSIDRTEEEEHKKRRGRW